MNAAAVERKRLVLVDTHCHLNFDRFDEDRPLVLERAAAAGVRWVLNPAIDFETSRAILALAEQHEMLYAAIGVHPNDADHLSRDWVEQLRSLAQFKKVAAIGEIGLDYYWDRTPTAVQKEIFQQQLELAAELDLPVIIHCRDKTPQERNAMQDTLTIISAWQRGLINHNPKLASRPGVLHSFSGDLSEALKAISSEFMIGVAGPVTFKKAENLQRVAAEIPEDYLLIETDAPFLTPHPHRGERNEPAYVRYIAEKIAELRQSDVNQVAHITTMNAERLFFGK